MPRSLGLTLAAVCGGAPYGAVRSRRAGKRRRRPARRRSSPSGPSRSGWASPATAPIVPAAAVPMGGATITAVGGDGSRFTLTIPPNALATDTTVTLTPVSSIAGLPTERRTGGGGAPRAGGSPFQPAGGAAHRAGTHRRCGRADRVWLSPRRGRLPSLSGRQWERTPAATPSLQRGRRRARNLGGRERAGAAGTGERRSATGAEDLGAAADRASETDPGRARRSRAGQQAHRAAGGLLRPRGRAQARCRPDHRRLAGDVRRGPDSHVLRPNVQPDRGGPVGAGEAASPAGADPGAGVRAGVSALHPEAGRR